MCNLRRECTFFAIERNTTVNLSIRGKTRNFKMELDKFDFDDPKSFFNELVKRALTDQNSKFEFVRNFEMLRTVRMYKAGAKKVSKVFSSLAKGIIAEYSGKISDDEQSLDILMALKQFETCRDYYKKEYDIAKDMLKEYRTYVFSGHILDQLFFNGVRPDNECVDYRKLPWKWF